MARTLSAVSCGTSCGSAAVRVEAFPKTEPSALFGREERTPRPRSPVNGVRRGCSISMFFDIAARRAGDFMMFFNWMVCAAVRSLVFVKFHVRICARIL